MLTHNSFTERRKVSLHRAFSGGAKYFMLAIAIAVLFSFMFFEANVIRNYMPELNDIYDNTPALRQVFDPTRTQQDQAQFRAHEILLRLGEFSNLDLLEPQHPTPQQQAFQWIVQHDPLQLGVDSHHLLQRYILALLWFSTTNEQTVWRNNELSWLSASHECDWKNPTGNFGILDCNRQKEVVHLFLPANNLHGTLPTELGYLTQLIYLDLQNNALTGQIPSELGNLRQLDYLGLSSNQLQGTVPDSLGQLKSLEQMLLHDNQFTGHVPTNICNLFAQGVLFNLWSDCNKEGMLVCECCTVCCAEPGTCGPRNSQDEDETKGIESETEIPNNDSMVSTEGTMRDGVLPVQVENQMEGQERTPTDQVQIVIENETNDEPSGIVALATSVADESPQTPQDKGITESLDAHQSTAVEEVLDQAHNQILQEVTTPGTENMSTIR